MSFVATPLTVPMRRAVQDAWARRVDGAAVRLHGGEESAAYRVDDLVIRVGPTERTTAETEWCHAIAVHAATTLPEAVAPLRTPDGATVIRVEDRPVSVWPYVQGEWPDTRQSWVSTHGAWLLARLHRALAAYQPPPRPVVSSLEIGLDGQPSHDTPAWADPSLDRWLADFHRRHPVRQPLHGDFYAGNTLTRNDRLVAVLDWDEATVGTPELEVASAALEWTGDSPDQLRCFVTDYHEAGGTAGDMNDEALAQLIRHRLRREAAYFERARSLGVEHDQDDLEYHERRGKTFANLRP